ncbi:MAG: class D sortase [Candidatus Krumholzibacteriia bacterium]
MKTTVVAMVLLLAGATLLARDACRSFKGAVATRLVDAATDRYLDDGGPQAPWPWADFLPVGRLRAPRLGVSRPVLAGGPGQTMAFGLTHVAGTARPGADGRVGLAGHRDRWAEFMGDLRVGDALVLETADTARTYVVAAVRVVDQRDVSVLAPDAGRELVLVTCYPVGGVTPTRQRLVVVASAPADLTASPAP